MSGWGNPWGTSFYWGGAGGLGPAFACDLADDRVLVQMDDTIGNRVFRDLVCVFVEDLGTYLDVLSDVRDAFDLSSAVGAQLDVIGRIVGLPREGYADARYRTLLEIQIELILSVNRDGGNWTGTSENILRICRKFIGTTPGQPVVLQNFPPYDFLLTVPTLAVADIPLLFRFLCRALYAGVLGQLLTPLAPDSLWNSASVAVPGGGIFCSASVAVPGCAIWGTAKTVGTCP